jgi:hypothetical protein
VTSWFEYPLTTLLPDDGYPEVGMFVSSCRITRKPENEWIEGNWRARIRFILRIADDSALWFMKPKSVSKKPS